MRLAREGDILEVLNMECVDACGFIGFECHYEPFTVRDRKEWGGGRGS